MMMIRNAAMVLFALVLAAGCDSDADTAEMDGTATDLPAVDTGMAGTGGHTMPVDGADLTTVDATLTEWSIALSRDSIAAGPIVFRVRNSGTMAHRFEVEGNNEEWETEDLAAGGEVMMSVNLTPGTYQVYCPVEADGPDHDERGMRTVLRVY